MVDTDLAGGWRQWHHLGGGFYVDRWGQLWVELPETWYWADTGANTYELTVVGGGWWFVMQL